MTLSEAIRGIQARLGVEPDGIIGSHTVAAMKVALDDLDHFKARGALQEGQGPVTAEKPVAATGGHPSDSSGAFDRALPVILRHEGGFVNHPKDPGGMTNLGVTKATWESWVGHPVDEKAMRALTPALVSLLYRKRYWDKLRGDELPPALALCVFDFGVNAGPARAARYLQRLAAVPDDGEVGPVTIAAVKRWVAGVGLAETVRQYSEARRAYYRQLSTFPTFGRGWLRRVDETESEALRLIR